MPARLVLATRNEHKVGELRAILAPLLPQLDPADIVGVSEFDIPEAVEDEVTFAGNALIKARSVATATGLPAIADNVSTTRHPIINSLFIVQRLCILD